MIAESNKARIDMTPCLGEEKKKREGGGAGERLKWSQREAL